MNKFKSKYSTFKRNEDGSIAIVFALTLTIVVGIAGGAIDFGRAFAERQNLQASVDAAAVAGARAVALQVGDAQSTATEIFKSNYEARGGGPTPNVQVQGQQVSVNASISVPAYLMQVMGIETLTVAATASAQPTYETIVTEPEPGGDVCILLLDPYKSEAFWASGNHQVDAPSCEVPVKSQVSSAAKINMGKPLDVKRVCIKGGAQDWQ